jgi:hypothetical protein
MGQPYNRILLSNQKEQATDMQKMWMQMDIKIILWNEKKPTKK